MDALKKALLERKRLITPEGNQSEVESTKKSRGQEDGENKSRDEDSYEYQVKNSSFEHEEQIRTKESAKAIDVEEPKKELTRTREEVIKLWIEDIMRSWMKELASRSEQESRTAQGRAALAAARETETQIEPLLSALQQRKLDKNILTRLYDVVSECKAREYRRAFDEYIKLTIGNAPWPVGVTMVGIHARSGREKIAESKVTHIMKDDIVRAYMTSIKRLMTKCQALNPPDAPSKRMA
jgi:pre-mRNA-splicing factor 18